jgi:hypothetical protein
MSQAVDMIIESASGPIATQHVRHKIEALEAEWKKLPQVEIPVVHRQTGGIYAREIIIPADTFLTGRIYKGDHFDVMIYGDITVTSDEGRKRLEGFNLFEGVRGKKRAGYTHSETKWITFCACGEMDEDDYLDHLTVESFDDLDKERDRLDYALVLEEYGFTEEVARSQSENPDDQIEIQGAAYGVKVGLSPIEGSGLFAEKTFGSGGLIMPARIGGNRTHAGRYVNHSASPNAVMVTDGSNINLMAMESIQVGDEVTTDYRSSLNLQIKKAG